jgi:hypothetical protein
MSYSFYNADVTAILRELGGAKENEYVSLILNAFQDNIKLVRLYFNNDRLVVPHVSRNSFLEILHENLSKISYDDPNFILHGLEKNCIKVSVGTNTTIYPNGPKEFTKIYFVKVKEFKNFICSRQHMLNHTLAKYSFLSITFSDQLDQNDLDLLGIEGDSYAGIFRS